MRLYRDNRGRLVLDGEGKTVLQRGDGGSFIEVDLPGEKYLVTCNFTYQGVKPGEYKLAKLNQKQV